MQSISHRLLSRVRKLRRMDVDLFWVAALFWTVSFLRVIGAAVRHEVFGTEATLALAAVLALPWIVLGAHRARRARRLDPR